MCRRTQKESGTNRVRRREKCSVADDVQVNELEKERSPLNSTS